MVFLLWCFCGGVVVFLGWCFWGGVLVVVFLWWCSCGGVFVVAFLWWCGGVFVVFLGWCFCGGVFVVVFVWCGCVFVVVWWCFCVGVMVFLCWCVGACYGAYFKIKKRWRGVGGEGAAPPPQCTHCKECIAGVDLVVVVAVVVAVVVVVVVEYTSTTTRPEDQGTRGQEDRGTRGPEDQRTRGPGDRRTRGPEDQKKKKMQKKKKKNPQKNTSPSECVDESLPLVSGVWMCSPLLFGLCPRARRSGTKNQELAYGTTWCWLGGPLAIPLAGMSAVGLLLLLLVVAGCWSVRDLRGLAWEDVGRVAPAAHPAPFVLP